MEGESEEGKTSFRDPARRTLYKNKLQVIKAGQGDDKKIREIFRDGINETSYQTGCGW